MKEFWFDMKENEVKYIITRLIAKSILRNGITLQDAEDFVQEAYLTAKTHLSEEDLEDPKRLYRYMNACIPNIILHEKWKHARDATEYFEKTESSGYVERVQDLRDRVTNFGIYDIEQIEIIILKAKGYNLKEIGDLMEINYENLKKKWAKIEKSFPHFPFSSV